jgi:hypothetical protein
MYGGGVQYGEAMRQAVHACKPGQVPALLALHFDKGLLGAFSRRDLGTPSRDAIPRCHPRTSVPHMHTRDVISGRRPEMSSRDVIPERVSHTYTHDRPEMSSQSECSRTYTHETASRDAVPRRHPEM